MRLFIAEKPSLGRAIAAVLPKPLQKGDGYIKSASGDVVSWCIGHLLEQAEPDRYDTRFKQWRLEHLPILPNPWQLEPKPKTRKQLTVLKSLIKQASCLVHAGDPDREGQLLVDEVISYLKVETSKRQSMQRLLISDLNPAAVKRALNQLQPNSNFQSLSISALARSRADWLYGINQTRAWTIKVQQSGRQTKIDQQGAKPSKAQPMRSGVVSIGRVQTPVLGLVVKRDRDIDNFVSHPFYQVEASIHLSAEQPVCLMAQWQPSEACVNHQDDSGRIINPKLVGNVATRIRQQPATIKDIREKQTKQPAPLPYNLSKLQIDAAKRFRLSAKRVLDICQSLYEKHQVITYPRSDCQYLPQSHHGQATQVCQAVMNLSPELQVLKIELSLNKKSRAWNDKKVSAHHAIIPTQKSSAQLSDDEKKIYSLISHRYLMQFMPDYHYVSRQLMLEIAGGLFIKNFKKVIAEGWKKSIKKLSPDSHQDTQALQDDMIQLPELTIGQILWSGEPNVLTKETEPPDGFTDATLLAAMTGISRFVSDKKLKTVLKETDGLGTEATRAGIIELLFKRGFLQRQGQRIKASEIGHRLIEILPAVCSTPDMTAYWERQLEAIQQGTLTYDNFMQPLLADIHQLIDSANNANNVSLQSLNQSLVQNPAVSNKKKNYFSKGKGKNSATNKRRSSNKKKVI